MTTLILKRAFLSPFFDAAGVLDLRHTPAKPVKCPTFTLC
jgi:hypothetical protein